MVRGSLSKRKVSEYIVSSVPKKEVAVTSRIGFSENVYIRPDLIVGKVKEAIILDTAIQDDSYDTSITLQEWKDLVARWCVGNSHLIFSISAVFASPLLNLCDLPNFGFHFVGNSSSGKTTCLNIAAKASKNGSGIFENLMGFQDGVWGADYLREKTSKYYGTASIEFIKQVLDHQTVIREQYKEELQKLKSQYLPANAEGGSHTCF